MSETTVMTCLIWFAAVMAVLWIGQAVYQWRSDRRELPRVEQPPLPRPSWVMVDMARARLARARHRAKGIR